MHICAKLQGNEEYEYEYEYEYDMWGYPQLVISSDGNMLSDTAT